MTTVEGAYSDSWRTPPELFRWLDKHYGFYCDLAATAENALCNWWMGDKGYGIVHSDWPIGEWCWCNPPYGKGIANWTRLFADYATKDFNSPRIVALLPANTDSKWFHRDVLAPSLAGHAHITWVMGRVQFLRGDGSKSKSGNASGSVIVQYGGVRKLPETVSWADINRGD